MEQTLQLIWGNEFCVFSLHLKTGNRNLKITRVKL